LRMKIDNRQRLLAVLAIVIVALFVADRMIITPLLESWRTRSAAITELRKSIEKGNALIQREAHTRGRWNEVRRSTLPVNASQAEKELFTAFEKWSADSRVSISSIRPQWKKGATEDYSVLECRVDAAGSLPVLAKFLHNIESSPIAVRTESVEFTGRDNNGEQIALGLLISAVRLAPVDAK
jgi:hypothetical protein